MLFALLLGWQIAGRGGLDHDELHSLLLGRLWNAGDVLSFHVGSVTRYEGGSWLIAWPVSWALRLGVPDGLAPPLAAAGIATFGLLGGALWLGRAAGWRAGLALGPIIALCVPEVPFYAQRAWGSLAEGLALLPWLALALDRWRRRPSWLGALALGAALGVSAVVSYVHAVTALCGLGLLLWWRRPRHALLAMSCSAAVFIAWLLVAVPHIEEAVIVRGGRGLYELLPHLLLPRLHRILPDLPAAVAGPGRSGSLAMGAAAGLALLGGFALVRAWRRGGRLRWLAIYALCAVPALSAGHALADAPEVHRYALPLLIVAAAALAACPGVRAVALLLAIPLWLPPPPVAAQPPHAVHAQLGANAQHRVHRDPHVKFKALWRVAEDWAKPWLAYGYGLDQGRRHHRVVVGMDERVAEAGGSPEAFVDNPHFALLEPVRWVAWARPLGHAAEHDAFLFGLGVGLGEDGRQARDDVLLAALRLDERSLVLGGYGAGLVRAGETGALRPEERPGACAAGLAGACDSAPPGTWAARLALDLPPGR